MVVGNTFCSYPDLVCGARNKIPIKMAAVAIIAYKLGYADWYIEQSLYHPSWINQHIHLSGKRYWNDRTDGNPVTISNGFQERLVENPDRLPALIYSFLSGPYPDLNINHHPTIGSIFLAMGRGFHASLPGTAADAYNMVASISRLNGPFCHRLNGHGLVVYWLIDNLNNHPHSAACFWVFMRDGSELQYIYHCAN